MTPLAFTRAHYPVTALGYGQRIGIWFQGCSIRCSGCIVPESWNATVEHEVHVEDLLASLDSWLNECDGVTISGGEPFDQPDALEALISGLRARITGDLLIYSGYTERRLRARHRELVKLPDVVIAGPFRADLPDDRPFIGSRNQTILLNSKLGHDRYENLETFSRRIDVAFATGEIRFAGVLRRGDLRRIVDDLQADGISSAATHAPV